MASEVLSEVEQIISLSKKELGVYAKNLENVDLRTKEREELIFITFKEFFKNKKWADCILIFFDEAVGSRVINMTDFDILELEEDNIFFTGPFKRDSTDADLFIIKKEDLTPKELLKKLKKLTPTKLDYNRITGGYNYVEGPITNIRPYNGLLKKACDVDFQLIVKLISDDEMLVLRKESDDYIETIFEKEDSRFSNQFFVQYVVKAGMLSYRSARIITIFMPCNVINKNCFNRVKKLGKELKKELETKISDADLIKKKIETVGKHIMKRVKGGLAGGLNEKDKAQLARTLAGLL